MQPGESPLKPCRKGLVLSYTSDSAQTHFKPTTAHKPGKLSSSEMCPKPKEEFRLGSSMLALQIMVIFAQRPHDADSQLAPQVLKA